MKTMAFSPKLSSTDDAAAFVESTLLSEGCPEQAVMKLCVVADELFSNIARYSGAAEASVSCGMRGDTAELIFRDNGTPYDPTAAKEPDVTLDAEARKIGGLGILMVRRFASELVYAYRDGFNELTVRMDVR